MLGAEDSGLSVLGGDDSGLTVLGGDDSGLTVLGGDDSGLTILGGEEPAAAAPSARGTPLVYAALSVVIVVFLVYLLYRHPSVSLVAFVGVLLLLVLGLSLHEGRAPAPAAGTPAEGPGTTSFVFYLEAPAPETQATRGASGAAVGSPHPALPAVRGLLLFTGTVMLASLLIVIALPKVRTRLRNAHLLFLLALGAAVLGVLLYASGGAQVLPGGLYVEAWGAILLGAILLLASMPRVQSRVKDIGFVLLAILCGALLVATWFSAGPQSGAGAASAAAMPAASSTTTSAPWPPPVGAAVLSGSFYGAVFWVLLAAGAIFLVTLPRIGARIRAYIAQNTGVKAFSYTGGFIVVAAVLALGAMFLAAELPLWKLGVAIVAASVVGRYAWRFLHRYRSGEILPAAARGPRPRRRDHPLAGAQK